MTHPFSQVVGKIGEDVRRMGSPAVCRKGGWAVLGKEGMLL